MTLSTQDEKNVARIVEIKEWLLSHSKKYDLSGINEQRVKLKLELEKLDHKDCEIPEIQPKEIVIENE